MLKVPQQEYIKYLREFEDLSISEIKENLGVNWRTAKKYADKDNWNKPLLRATRVSPVMEDFKDIVDTWISEDQLIHKKLFTRDYVRIIVLLVDIERYVHMLKRKRNT